MRTLVVLALVLGCCLCVSAQTTVIGVAATAGTPVFSPAAGTITSGTQISMSTTPSSCNSYIYWNFTGTSMPSGTNSTTSSAITTTSTLYAQVIGCPGYINSAIGSAAYTVNVSCTPNWSFIGYATPTTWSTGNTMAANLSAAPSTGQTPVVHISVYNGSGTVSITSVKDSNNNSYTLSTPNGPANGNPTGAQVAYLAYILSAPSNATSSLTITFGSTPTSGGAFGEIFSDANACGNYQADAVATGTASTITTPTMTATTSAGLYILMACSNGSISSINSPWTQSAVLMGANGCGTGYILNGSGAEAAAATNSGNVAFNSIEMVIN